MCFHFAQPIRMGLDPHLPDLPDTGSPVGPENEAEYFRHEIIEFPARHGVRELLAVGTRSVLVFNVAGTQLAPGSLLIFTTSGAFILQIPSASPAIQTAIGHQGRVRYDFFHLKHLPKR
jgi:hypothetical protein